MTGTVEGWMETRRLPLRKRGDLVSTPLLFGMRRYWGVKDPVALRYFQLRDEEYSILELLDGTRSLAEIQREFERRYVPRRLLLPQLQAFLAMLHREGLIVGDRAGQGDELLRRRNEQRRRRWLSVVANPFAIRFRGVDPERLLAWLAPRCEWLFSGWWNALCTVLVGLALGLVLFKGDALFERLPDFYAFFSLHHAGWFVLAIICSKVLHELGHSLACKHFGGECHELGLLLLVGAPCLYCNVSDAWMLPGKWPRIAISLAGMWVELVLASVATLVWWWTSPGIVNSLCLHLMFVCSLATLLFNGNPLLRYDGYFVLSDAIETPNLYEQATAVARQATARWLFGVNLVSERVLPAVRRGWLGAYFVASFVYRVFVTWMVMWFLIQILKPYGMEGIAQLLGSVALLGIVTTPLVQTMGALRSRQQQLNWRQFRLRGSIAAGLLAALLFVPLPHRVAAPAVVQPEGATRLYVSVPGTLREALAAGSVVNAGDVVARLEDLNLQTEVEKLRSRRDQQRLHVSNLKRRMFQDPAAAAEMPSAEESLADFEQRLQQRELDRKRLTILAPAAGTVLPPHKQPRVRKAGELSGWWGTPLEPHNIGSHLATGTLVCLIGDPQRMEMTLVVDQSEVDFVQTGQRVRMQCDEAPPATIWGTITELSQINLSVAPRELVAQGTLPARQEEGNEARPLSASYQARVKLDDDAPTLLTGAAARAKIHVAPRSIWSRLNRAWDNAFRVR